MHYFHQDFVYTCGPTALRMVLDSFRIKKSSDWLMKELRTSRRSGTKRGMFSAVCEKLDLDFVVHRNSSFNLINSLIREGFIVIVAYTPSHDNFYHYAVVSKVSEKHIFLFDPWYGPDYRLSRNNFKKIWHDDENHHWLIGIKRPDSCRSC